MQFGVHTTIEVEGMGETGDPDGCLCLSSKNLVNNLSVDRTGKVRLL